MTVAELVLALGSSLELSAPVRVFNANRMEYEEILMVKIRKDSPYYPEQIFVELETKQDKRLYE